MDKNTNIKPDKYIKCDNTKCINNKNGYCKEMTEKHLLNRIRCDERIW